MATTSNHLADLHATATRNPFSAGEVEAAIYTADIDRIAATWSMTTEEAIAWQNRQELVLRQPTTISDGARAAGVQLSMLDLLGQEPGTEHLLPNLARYQSGKSLLERACLLSATKRNHLSHKGPVICRNRVFYTLVPCEA